VRRRKGSVYAANGYQISRIDAASIDGTERADGMAAARGFVQPEPAVWAMTGISAVVP
jgi:hypothetical protein